MNLSQTTENGRPHLSPDEVECNLHFAPLLPLGMRSKRLLSTDLLLLLQKRQHLRIWLTPRVGNQYLLQSLLESRFCSHEAKSFELLDRCGCSVFRTAGPQPSKGRRGQSEVEQFDPTQHTDIKTPKVSRQYRRGRRLRKSSIKTSKSPTRAPQG
jgi:hypothetical protein